MPESETFRTYRAGLCSSPSLHLSISPSLPLSLTVCSDGLFQIDFFFFFFLLVDILVDASG